MDGQGVKAP